MVFKEAYNFYKPGVRDIKSPLCSETKINLFEQMTDLENYAHTGIPKIEYFKLYLDSCGDITKPRKPFINYEVYINLYSEVFERDLRTGLTRNPKTNYIYCNIFNIPKRYNNMTFDTITDYSEQRQTINTAKKWVREGFRECLVLGSKTRGIGKTNTLVCTAMEYFIEYDYSEIKKFTGALAFLNSSIIFIKERELIKLLENPALYKGVILDRLAQCAFLVYDDMLSVGDASFAKNVLFDILDARIDEQGKPTAISTTVQRHVLERNYPDIASRISRGKVYYSDSTKDIRAKSDGRSN
jgi:DNA replication protein DnaC